MTVGGFPKSQDKEHKQGRGMQVHLASGSPKRPSVAPSLLAGTEMSGGEMRREFISMRPTSGRQWTKVSKTVFSIENTSRFIRRKCGAKGAWGSKGQLSHLRSITGGLAGI